jgi:hypothetical protein
MDNTIDNSTNKQLNNKYLHYIWDSLPYLICLGLIVLFWSSALSTSWARIAALQTIEGYAMAVHEQLMLNFDLSGSFSQTIHKGYDDTWTWSGHRALTLPIVAKLYGLHPSPLWLSGIMISFVTLGGIAAGDIGYRALENKWGWTLGMAIYLGCPATMALALQDYQDLIFALPCLVICCSLMQRKSWYWIIMGAIVGILPREECVPMVVACAVIMVPFKGSFKPEWKFWLRNIALSAIIAFLYAQWAEATFPLATSGHDMPLENALLSLGHKSIFLEGWLYKTRFYALVWIPLGSFALLAPLIAAPAIAIILLHMTVPEGHGVDRSWSGHCHHMAPAVAFAVVSTIIGSIRLFRWLSKYSWGSHISKGIALCSFLWMGWWWNSWSGYYNLRISLIPSPPTWEHPAWELISELSEDDIPIVSKNTAITASHFIKSYTFDESLYQKESQRGLVAGTHIIVDSRRSDVLQWIEQFSAAELQKEIEGFRLYDIQKVSRDPFVQSKPKFKKPPPYTGEFKKGELIPGVPPYEKKIKVVPGSFPVIQF